MGRETKVSTYYTEKPDFNIHVPSYDICVFYRPFIYKVLLTPFYKQLHNV